jgi:thioredoxin 1
MEGMESASTETEPSRAEVDALAGPVMLEFGTSWCGWCRRAQPLIGAALAAHPDVLHIKVEDGPGQPLGRSFRVKLWPTLVFMRDGKVVGQLVRPDDSRELTDALQQIDPAAG